MPKSPDISTLTRTKHQYKLTVPKPIAEALQLPNKQKVHWRITGKGKLEITLL